MSIFMISDLHLFHGNIILYENRPFKNTDEMNKVISNNWNNVIKNEDTVFCLGDVAFGNKDMIKNIVSKLNGKKNLILGNHDRSRNIKWWQDCGFDFVSRYPIIFKQHYILSHEPMYINEYMPYINIHGHLHSKKMQSQKFINVSVECINYTPIDFELEIKYKYEPETEKRGIEGEIENELD